MEGGCACNTGYIGSITAVNDGYYFNGAYDGVCHKASAECGVEYGFAADVDKTKTYGGGWNEMREFRVQGLSSLYNVGNHFAPYQGQFVAPTSGYYLCSTQIRIENFGSSYTRVTIAIDGTKDDHQNGMTTILGDYASTNYRAQGLSGVIYVKAKQYVSVWVQSTTDNSWQVHSESGFSCHQLRSHVGFHADKKADQKMATGYREVHMMCVHSCACTH